MGRKKTGCVNRPTPARVGLVGWMGLSGLLLSVSAPALAVDTSPSGKNQVEQILVLPFSVSDGVEASKSLILDEIVLNELSSRAPKGVRVIGASDLQAVLGVEQQKQLLSCSDNSCLVEIGNAMGASHIMVNSVGQLGSQFVLSSKLIEVSTTQVRFRKLSYIEAKEDALVGAIRQLCVELANSMRWSKSAVTAEQVGTSGVSAVPKDLDAQADSQVDAKSDSLADSEAEDALAINPMLIGGAVTAGLGLLAAGGLGAFALVQDQQVNDLNLTTEDRLAARDQAMLFGGLSGGGLGVALLGLVLLGVALF